MPTRLTAPAGWSIAYHRPGEGIFSGNSIRFPISAAIQLFATPQYDESNRVVKYIKYRLDIDAVFVGEDFANQGLTDTEDLDEGIAILRKTLNIPGGTLLLQGIGLGSDLESVEPSEDFAYGPHPLDLRIRPVAGAKAFFVYWSIEFTRTICDGSEGKLGAFNYTVSISTNEKGLKERVLNISIEVQALRNGATANSQIDTIGSNVNYPRIPGFKRNRQRTISQDKRTSNITITDTEIGSDNPYPKNITDIRVSQSIDSVGRFAMANWQMDISGTIEHAPGASKADCFNAMGRLIGERQARVRAAQLPPAVKGGVKPELWLMHMSLSDEIYSRSIRFSTTWKLICSLETILAATGLFTPVAGNWQEWSTSMDNLIGIEGLKDVGNWDNNNLINFCFGRPEDTSAPSDSTHTPRRPEQVYYNCPQPGNSWLHYNLVPALKRETGAVPVPTTSPGDALNQSQVDAAISTTLGSRVLGTVGSLVGRAYTYIFDGSPSQIELHVYGHAERVGYPIPIPTVTSIGGSAVTPITAREHIEPSHVVGYSMGCPVYRAYWHRVYLVTYPMNGTKTVMENVPPHYEMKDPTAAP